jgi:type VI protein secretion system component VasK
MKPSVLCGLGVLVLCTALGAAQQPHYEGLVKDMLATVDEITTILMGVTDEEKAKEAAPSLKKQAEKMVELRKKADAWKQPDKAEKDRLAKEYAPKFEEAVKKLRDQTLRVGSVTGGEAALKELAILHPKKDTKDKKKGDK